MQFLYTTPTPDLELSKSFYSSLGFEIDQREKICYAISSQLVIEINPVRTARAGIKIYGIDQDEFFKSLNSYANITKTDAGFLLSDPSNVWMYFENAAIDDILDLGANKELCGNFVGMSLESTDIQRSINIWSCLGLKKTMGDINQGWVAYGSDSGLNVSFMVPNVCPHLFFNPSFTYFNSGKNPEIIAKLREAKVPIKEEITLFNPNGEVDNVILQDPGGFGFFVFND